MNKQKMAFLIFGAILLGSIFWGVGEKSAIKNIENNAFATIHHEEFLFTRELGVTLKCQLYYPLDLDESKIYPLVLLQHGMGGRQENFMGMAFAFCNRGFIVITTNLRNSYGSEGHTTLGDQESWDLLAILDAAKKGELNIPVQIGAIGLVGHSLGALTVTLAALRGNVNLCVAMSPPGNFTGLITPMLNKIDFKFNPPLKSNNNFTDPAYLATVTLTSYSAPPNYMLIGGELDAVVPSSTVYSLFKHYTNNDSALPNVTYGNFGDKTALRYEEHRSSHGDMQFAYFTPSITKSVIKWTEQAMEISTTDEPIELPDVVYSLELRHDHWNRITNVIFPLLIISTFGLMVMVATIIPKRTSKFIDYNPISIHAELKSVLFSSSTHSFLLGGIIGIVFGLFLPFPFSSTFFFTNIVLNLMWPIFCGSIGGILGFIIFQIRQQSKGQSNASNVNTNQIRSVLIEFGFSILVGLIPAIVATEGFALFFNPVGMEYSLKPLPHFPLIGWMLLLYVLYGIVIHGFLEFVILYPLKSQKARFIVPLLLSFSILLLFGLISNLFGPFLTVIIEYAGFTIPVGLGLIILPAVLGLGVAALNLFFRNTFSTGIPAAVFVYWCIGWFLLSYLMAF
jgi:pimeloyl-ACP methyl ester carboxylesterase